MLGMWLKVEVLPLLHDIVLSPKCQCELTPVSQVRGERGMKEALTHIWRGVWHLLVSLKNILGIVGMWLKLEDFWSSCLLKNGPI